MSDTLRVLIVNQHGDNRGDEAAMLGMIEALSQRLPGARFTVLHQFAAPESQIGLPGVEYLPLRLPVLEAVRLALWATIATSGVRLRRLPGDVGRRIVAAYEEAAVVVSAPGGPYFGDPYADHEVVHWFYVWLGRLHRRPMALYQPSAGPFGHRWLAPVRRRGLRWFDVLATRESISADHVERLAGRRPVVGSDSALSRRIPAADVTEWTDAAPDGRAPSGIVTATFRDPGERRREAHDRAVVAALRHLTGTGRRVLLLPQLHGPRHRDQPYLERLAAAARREGADVLVLPDTLDSDAQRGLVAASDLVLAGRYHPLVFAVSAGVPAIVIPYEHKATGIAHAAGLDDHVVELDEIDPERLVAALDTLLGRLDEVRSVLAHRSAALAGAADRTAELVTDLVRPRPGGPT